MTTPGVDLTGMLRPVRQGNAFEETVERLLTAIKLGVVAPGERFPAERELAAQLGISRLTLREAIRELHEAGYVCSRRGRFGGTFVTYTRPAPDSGELRRLALQDADKLTDALRFRLAVETGAAEALACQFRPGDAADRPGDAGGRADEETPQPACWPGSPRSTRRAPRTTVGWIRCSTCPSPSSPDPACWRPRARTPGCGLTTSSALSRYSSATSTTRLASTWRSWRPSSPATRRRPELRRGRASGGHRGVVARLPWLAAELLACG